MRQLLARARRVLPRTITHKSRPRRDGELCRTTQPFATLIPIFHANTHALLGVLTMHIGVEQINRSTYLFHPIVSYLEKDITYYTRYEKCLDQVVLAS